MKHDIKPKGQKQKAPVVKSVPAVKKTGGWNQLINVTFRVEQQDEKQSESY